MPMGLNQGQSPLHLPEDSGNVWIHFWLTQVGVRIGWCYHPAGRAPRMPLNILQSTGQPSVTKRYPARDVNSTKTEKLRKRLKK